MRTRILTLDPWVNRLLAAIAVFLLTIAIELWGLSGALPATAVAQVPDTGLQRKQLIDEARRTNELLSAILDQLRGGVIKVESVNPDKEKGPGRAGARRTEP